MLTKPLIVSGVFGVPFFIIEPRIAHLSIITESPRSIAAIMLSAGTVEPGLGLNTPACVFKL